MTAAERLIRYCRIDTQSDEAGTGMPSAQKELDLSRLLVKELQEMGVKDAELDEYGYVYAHLPSNLGRDCPKIGFIAHVDTAPDFSGTGVNPRVIENYDGKDIVLNKERTTKVSEYPYLKKCVGKTLIVTDGNTLLGGDDKAGVTAIMEAVSWFRNHPEAKHGDISIGFTPDEEIGRGPLHFDLKKFNADFAYTMDGGQAAGWCDETFNAAEANLKFHGVAIHPGSAKDIMVNALNLAMEFHGDLPDLMRPEHTEKRQPFFHITSLNGTSSEASSSYIIRAHEKSDFAMMKQMMRNITARMNELYGYDAVELDLKDQYYNMHDVLKDKPEITGIAQKALKALGIEPVHELVRGGTDGSQLTYMGLPCPNLGTGGQNCHGPYEYVVVEEMEQAAQLIEKIAELAAEESR